jgi:hypothetical protein
VPEALRKWAYPKLLPSSAFVDLGGDASHTVYVAGSQRSGTTWLASLLVEMYRCRLVFEPLREDHVPDAVGCSFNRYLDPGAHDGALERYALDALSGRVRSPWSDRWNTVRVARRRVVKEIGQNLLLPWIARRFPQMPVVLVLKHPLTSAFSAAELGWADRLAETLDQPELLAGPLSPMAAVVREFSGMTDPFLRQVLRWCVETYVPVQLLDRERVVVVFFENLSRDPRREMDRVSSYLDRFGRRGWRARAVDSRALRRPSFTDWRRTAGTTAEDRFRTSLERIGGRAQEAMALVSEFGLDGIYGRVPDPLVAPGDLLVHRARASSP